MKRDVILLIALMVGVPSAWAIASQPTQRSDAPASPSSDDAHLRVDELPQSVQEMLAEIQRLSAKVEPEIVRFGRRFREEVSQGVKKLREAAKTDKPDASPDPR